MAKKKTAAQIRAVKKTKILKGYTASQIRLEYIDYYKKRDKITEQRKAGKHKNLTNDPILSKFVFLNNNRNDDRGSRNLYALIKGKTEHERLLYSAIYRFSSSSKLLLSQLTGNVNTDLKLIGSMPKLRNGQMIYQYSFHKQGERYLLTTAIPEYIKNFLPIWKVYKNKNLLDASIELGDICYVDRERKDGTKFTISNPFVAHQILADMSYFYPVKLDKNSLCYMGRGAYEAMAMLKIPRKNKIKGGTKTYKELSQIKDILKCSWLEMEHSLCEFNKFFEIKHGIKEGRKFTPTIP